MQLGQEETSVRGVVVVEVVETKKMREECREKEYPVGREGEVY